MKKMTCILLFLLLLFSCVLSAQRYEKDRAKDKECNRALNTSQTFTVNGVSFDMIYVEGGTFQIYQNRTVTLLDYYIGQYEVTQDLWLAVMGSNPSFFKGGNLPVEQVSRKDCLQFISKLNQLTGKRFSLPTSAEWVYAARGGKKSRGYAYSGSNDLDDVGWNWNNSGDRKTTGDWLNYEEVSRINCKTHPVGGKQPNELGIYDMTGNVSEFSLHRNDSYSSAKINSEDANKRLDSVTHGGSWDDFARYCRISIHFIGNFDFSVNRTGFRLILIP